MTFTKPYDPLEQSNVAVLYGTGPMESSPRVEQGDQRCPVCGGMTWPSGMVCLSCRATAAIVAPPVDPPPSYAASNEIAACAALDKLTPEEASRVLAWACSKFGVPGPVLLALGVEKAEDTP